MADDMSSLQSLEEELTCSICLSPFDSPVTTPCGHNFCEDCLDLTWQGSDLIVGFNCPQCRFHFSTKPDLRRNTVLNAVVDKFREKLNTDIFDDVVTTKTVPDAAPIVCDVCMAGKACKTCLTCMVSYCVEHVRPHLENPVFAVHQLHEPLADLRERICPDHSKIIDFFCLSHVRCICSVCLQQEHKGCTFCTPDEQRVLQESDLKKKLSQLDGKINKNRLVLSQMKEQQCVLKDSATSRKRELEMVYGQIREMLDRDEQQAMKGVDKEEEGTQSKLSSMMKKFDRNVAEMSGARDRIDGLLSRTQSLAFLQASVDLPKAVELDPFAPRLNINADRAHLESAAALKEYLGNVLKQPVESRASLLKPGPSNPVNPGPPPAMKERKKKTPPAKKAGQDSHQEDRPSNPVSPGPPPAMKKERRKKTPSAKKTGQDSYQEDRTSMKLNDEVAALRDKVMNLDVRSFGNLNLAGAQPCRPPASVGPPPSLMSPVNRSDLLKYGTALTLDHRTAHRRIVLLENLTKASVSDEPCAYKDGPARFSVCSQVLCNQGFSQGRHYWEVKMTSSNFCGVGLAYGSVDRKGPGSRLGRNAQSWCLEWFNARLSAWHDTAETALPHSGPSRVGVLLDCGEGTATFYNVAERAYPIHTFVYPFSEPVHPAFWLFSSGTAVTLCKLVC